MRLGAVHEIRRQFGGIKISFSRNQLHSTANLNFSLMGKTLLGFVNKLFSSVQLIVFLIMFCFLLNWCKNSNYFKIAVWQSDSMKRNFWEFISPSRIANLTTTLIYVRDTLLTWFDIKYLTPALSNEYIFDIVTKLKSGSESLNILLD